MLVGPVALVAVKVIENVPACVGVPDSVPVPEPAVDAKVTPVGRTPVWVIVGVGPPVVVMVKVPAVATVKLAELALVTIGGAIFTGVKVVVADAGLVPVTLVAVTEQVYGVLTVRPVMA